MRGSFLTIAVTAGSLLGSVALVAAENFPRTSKVSIS